MAGIQEKLGIVHSLRQVGEDLIALPREQRTVGGLNTKIKTNLELNLTPLGGRVVVEAIVEDAKAAKKGGIIIPDSAREKPTESMVVAVGAGKISDDGKRIPIEVKKGDRVLVSKYGGTEIKIEDRDYTILNADDILAVIE